MFLEWLCKFLTLCYFTQKNWRCIRFRPSKNFKCSPKKSVTSGPPRIECPLTFLPFRRPKSTHFLLNLTYGNICFWSPMQVENFFFFSVIFGFLEDWKCTFFFYFKLPNTIYDCSFLLITRLLPRWIKMKFILISRSQPHSMS